MDIIKSFQKIKISHAYCEANGLVDHFANVAIWTNDEKVWRLGDCFSANVKALLQYNLAQVRQANLFQ